MSGSGPADLVFVGGWVSHLEVKSVGDGFLATFDRPARAIRCACAIRDDARHLGIDVRAGLHTGECELIGDDIGGLELSGPRSYEKA